MLFYFQNLKDYYFGKIQLKGMHLSRLHSVNSQGYYESDYYLEFWVDSWFHKEHFV